MTNEERSVIGGRWPIIVILTTFLLLGFAYSAINPLHEATDELRHYRFVQHLIQRHSLPVQGEAGGLDCTVQGHHPPLYYLVAALVTAGINTGRDVCYQPPINPFWDYRYWEVGRDNKNQYLHGPDEAFPWRGEALAAHLARVVNLLFGMLTVWLTWATARAIWPRRPSLAVGSAAFVAFNPMFLYMAAAINNDVVAAAAGAAVIYACVRLLHDERGLSWRWGLWLGALYGLALMSKFNLAAIIVVIEVAVTWVAWRRGQWRLWLGVNLLIVGVAGLLAGWWFVRNQLLYGEPTGFEMLTELWGVRDPRDSFRLAVSELPYAWTSLWGRFGYGQIPLPSWIYAALFGVLLASVGGYVRAGMWGRNGEREKEESDSPLLLLALNVAVFFAVLFNYLLVSPAGPMGRFFFPALSSLAILMFYGLTLLVHGKDEATPDKLPATNQSPVSLVTGHWRLAVTINLLMLALSFVALFGYLRPAYARPPSFAAGISLPNPADVRFDTFVALRGYAVDTERVRPGEPVGIELYWEVLGTPPGDYLLFVHLTDAETGALVAYYRPYAERYMGMVADVLEGPAEETPGWHAGELETSQCLCHNAELVRMDRAVKDKAHAPKWLSDAWSKKDGMPNLDFQGYSYFDMPFEHEEFTDSGIMGNPHRGAAYKGEVAFNRFSNHLIDAVHEFEKVEVQIRNADWTEGKTMGGGL